MTFTRLRGKLWKHCSKNDATLFQWVIFGWNYKKFGNQVHLSKQVTMHNIEFPNRQCNKKWTNSCVKEIAAYLILSSSNLFVITRRQGKRVWKYFYAKQLRCLKNSIILYCFRAQSMIIKFSYKLLTINFELSTSFFPHCISSRYIC